MEESKDKIDISFLNAGITGDYKYIIDSDIYQCCSFSHCSADKITTNESIRINPPSIVDRVCSEFGRYFNIDNSIKYSGIVKYRRVK